MSYLESILGQNEKVVFGTRRHWLVVWRPVLMMFLLSLLIGIVVALLLPFTTGASVVGLVLLVIPLGRILFVMLEWANEVYIVTNRRIIQLEGVFNKHVVDSSLEKVNDVVMDQTFWGRIWGYGNIEIMTASDIGVNKLEMLSQPVKFKTTMLDQKENLSDGDGFRRTDSSATSGPPGPDDIPAIIAQLAALRDRGILTADEFERKKAELMSQM